MLESYKISQLEAGGRPGSMAIFNSKSTADIVTALDEWNSKRVLLVYSKSLAAATTHISDLKSALSTRLITSKEGIGSHSPYPDVIDVAHRITDFDVDCVVCVGSGSYSDACKAARLLAATLPSGFGEEEMEALMDQSVGTTPDSVMKVPTGVKLILVPTSLSAGEWSYAASATNSKGKKQHFSHKNGCAADLILMDPWLAATAPEDLWLSSGIRAVDHCCETLCQPKCEEHPDAQRWCEQALMDLSKGLVEYKNGRGGDKDELIRGISKCQAGSRMALMSLLVYRIPMGASHAIGHQLGSVAGVMHGITSCIMLPAVLRHTNSSTLEAQKRIVKVFNKSMEWQEEDAANCVARLVKLVGLPSSLKEVGVTSKEQIEKIIDGTMTDIAFSFGAVMTRQEVSQIVYSAR